MADSKNKDLKPKGKMEVSTPAEQTYQGPSFTPAVDIFETEQEIIILADMPGAKAKDLKIDLRDDTLSLIGKAESPEGTIEADVFREYQTGRYVRQFTLSYNIDQPKIDAEMKDGVLRLTLPKVEAAKPRKIAVKAG